MSEELPVSKLKKFKIEETFRVTGFTTILAKDVEEAKKKLEEGEGYLDYDHLIREEHLETNWDSLKEVSESINLISKGNGGRP
jgi:hypothetical protein